MKISEKNSRKKLVKCAIEVAGLHKASIQSCTQTAFSESSIALGRLNLNLAHLFIMYMATIRGPQMFNVCQGT